MKNFVKKEEKIAKKEAKKEKKIEKKEKKVENKDKEGFFKRVFKVFKKKNKPVVAPSN